MKKIIFEQKDNSKNLEILKKAINLGCFQNLDLIIDKEPSDVEGITVLKATGKTSQNLYYIYAEPKIIQLSTDKGQLKKWTCSNLDLEIEKLKQQQSPSTDDKDLSQEQPLDLKTATQKAKELLKVQKIEPKQCRDSINILYQEFENLKKGYKPVLTDEIFNVHKDTAQKCVRNKNVWRNLPLIGDKLEKKVKELQSINQRDTVVGKFRLLEMKSLNNLIKKTLLETKLIQEEKQISKKIVESRFKLILDDLNNFQKLDESKKVKIGFRVMKESSIISNLGLINENLSDIFKSIYGKSFDAMIDTISEPLLNLIFNKISLDEDLKIKSLENIKGKMSEFLANMDSCQKLSKFISDIIMLEFIKKLDVEKISQSDVIDQSIKDSINQELFRKNLNTKLETHICQMYNKFTENAKNLVVRMTAL